MKPETPTDARILAQGAVVTSRRTKNRQLTNLSENARKSFRMTSLQKISQQLSWIDILTKKHGGVGPGLFGGRVRAVLAARAIFVPLAN